MVDICEDGLKPCGRRQERLVCEASGGLQEGCRAGIWCAPISICCCRYPAQTWSKDQMWEIMTCCVILHNMIIESEQEDPVFDTEPYYRQGPLAEVDHQLPATWTAYLSMRQEIRDPQVHHQLQKDLIEHLWRLKGDAA